MPIEMFELHDSRETTVSVEPSSSATLRYGIVGTYDDIDVHIIAQFTLPNYFRALPFKSYTIKPQGGGCWELDAKYDARVPLQPTDDPGGGGGGGGGGPGEGGASGIQSGQSGAMSFDTTGGKERKTQAIGDSTYFYAPGFDGVDFQGAINVSGDGNKRKVEGVDVTVPEFHFTITRAFRHPLSQAYFDKVYDLTGFVNTDVVTVVYSGITIVCQPGELLFFGGRGRQRGSENWEIELVCAKSPNRTNFTLGPITGINKKGWQYLWLYYKQAVDGMDWIKEPKQATVDTVFETGALAPLFA